jgi:hypothetical protein
LAEEVVLESALGSDVGLKGGSEEVELFELFGADDQVAGVEAVFEGVLGGAGFALGGAGAGGKLGVGDVGCLLGCG